MADAGETSVTSGRLEAGRPAIAYVVHSLDPGGTERLAFDMSREFSRDFDLQVYCLDRPGRWATDLRDAGIPVHCLWRQAGLDIAVAHRLAAACKRDNISLIHAHQCTPWFYSALSRLLNLRPRLLLEEHGRFYPEVDSTARKFVNRWLISRLTHRIVAVSEDVKRRLVRYEGLSPENIEVIYNGVHDAERPAPQSRDYRRREFGIGPDSFVVGTVGRLDPVKNLTMFVEALEIAGRAVGKLFGLIVGDGPEYDTVKKRADDLGLGEKLILTGYRADARRIAACMDVFVLPSLSEGTSMALLEAMSAAVPVLVTDVGGNPEIVRHGQSGLIVPSNDSTAIADAIIRLSRSTELRSSLGDGGRRRFEENFSFDAMLGRYRSLYADLLVAQPEGS